MHHSLGYHRTSHESSLIIHLLHVNEIRVNRQSLPL